MANVENMSVEELEAALQAKQAAKVEQVEQVVEAEAEMLEADVRGIHFEVPKTRLESWKFMRLYAAMVDARKKATPTQRMANAMAFMDYMLGDYEDEILEALGDDADSVSANDYMEFAMEVVNSLTPKN